MKKVTLILRDPDINRMIGTQIELSLHDRANILDMIQKVDKIIGEKGPFPVEGFKSLLHLTFNPVENRFYEHVALTAYCRSQRFLNVRANPTLILPNRVTVVLALTICGGEWEEVVDM